MIEVHHDTLHFSFHDVHADAHFRLSFQRTLRIPDDNRSYPLPPGLGDFPLYRVDDHAARLPPAWREHGGVFLPIAQSEAMWLSFSGSYPMALRIASGKIDAVTGEPWSDGLTEERQNYVVVPEQPWLDGFCVAKGSIRQFVAMPLGTGYTAEEQLTGEAVHGGLQVGVHPMKRNAYLEYRSSSVFEDTGVCYSPPADKSSREMGLAPGGLMKQELAADPHDFDVWEPHALARCFVHILNAKQFFEVTGARPPEPPPTAASYTEAGLPWFEYYGGDVEALAAAPAFAELDSVAAMTIKQGDGVLPDNDPVTPRLVRPMGPVARAVREISATMRLKRITYDELNSKQREIFNFQKLAARLADYGFNCIKLDDDWQGADFLAYHKDGSTTLKVQLKARAVISKKYRGKDLYLAFPADGLWYLLPHDELVAIAAETTSWLQSPSWIERGLYSVVRPSRRMLERLSDHAL